MARKRVRLRDVWAGTQLGSGVYLMDVRTPGEYRDVHIPGAHNIPLGDLNERIDEVRQGANQGSVAIICHTTLRSKVVYDECERLGIRDAAIVNGGMVSWIDAGLPVVRGNGHAATAVATDEGSDLKRHSAQCQAQILMGSVVLIGVAIGKLFNPWFLLLSAVVGAGLVYSGITESCPLATVLARLPFNRAHAR